MKKKMIFVASFFMLGILITFLFDVGLLQKIKQGVSQIPFWMYFVLFIGSFYLTLTVHELGHLISFVIQKVGIRALYITMFVFYRKTKSFRMTVKPKMMKLLGGMVFPNLKVIEDEETYQKMVQSFSKALIAGPIATIVFAVVYSIFFIGMWIFSSSIIWIGYLWLLLIFIWLLSILYIFASKLHTDVFYGDFVARRKIVEDPEFAFSQLEQYRMFSLHDQSRADHFFAEKSKRILIETPMKYTVFHMNILYTYLTYHHRNKVSSDAEVDKKMNAIHFMRLLNNKEYWPCAIAVAAYYYLKDDLDKAYGLVNTMCTYFENNQEEAMKYYIEDLFYIAVHPDSRDFDVSRDDHEWIFDILIREEDTSWTIPFKVYWTEVYCPIENTVV